MWRIDRESGAQMREANGQACAEAPESNPSSMQFFRADVLASANVDVRQQRIQSGK
jgi:hypothetical protein